MHWLSALKNKKRNLLELFGLIGIASEVALPILPPAWAGGIGAVALFVARASKLLSAVPADPPKS